MWIGPLNCRTAPGLKAEAQEVGRVGAQTWLCPFRSCHLGLVSRPLSPHFLLVLDPIMRAQCWHSINVNSYCLSCPRTHHRGRGGARLGSSAPPSCPAPLEGPLSAAPQPPTFSCTISRAPSPFAASTCGRNGGFWRGLTYGVGGGSTPEDPGIFPVPGEALLAPPILQQHELKSLPHHELVGNLEQAALLLRASVSSLENTLYKGT